MTSKKKLHTALETSLAQVHLSQARREAILAAVEKGEEDTTKKQWTLRTGLIAAALCAVLAVGALAASPALREAIDQALGSFGPYSQEVEGVSCTDQGITLRVVRTLADENGGTVYLEATDHTGNRLSGKSVLEGYNSSCLAYDPESRTALFGVDIDPMWYQGRDEAGNYTLEFGVIQPAVVRFNQVELPWELVTDRRLDSMTLSTQDCVECMDTAPVEANTVLVPNQTPADLGTELFTLSSMGFDQAGAIHVQIRLADGVTADVGEIWSSFPALDESLRATLGARWELGERHTTFVQDGIYYKDICFTGLTDSQLGRFSIEFLTGQVHLGETIQGQWRLTFPLKLLPQRVITLEETINGQVLESITITATTVRKTARYLDPEHPTVLGYQLSVYLADGSVLTVPYDSQARRQTLYQGEDGALSPKSSQAPAGEAITWSLPQAVDPQEVVGIAIGQRYFPIRSDNTAGPGSWLAQIPQTTRLDSE